MQAMLQGRDGASQSARNRVVMAAALSWIALIFGSLYWNWVQVGRSMTALAIKGASASVGGERLREAALQVEKAARAVDLDGARSLMPEVELQFGRLKEAMEREMG